MHCQIGKGKGIIRVRRQFPALVEEKPCKPGKRRRKKRIEALEYSQHIVRESHANTEMKRENHHRSGTLPLQQHVQHTGSDAPRTAPMAKPYPHPNQMTGRWLPSAFRLYLSDGSLKLSLAVSNFLPAGATSLQATTTGGAG
eukprot:1150340-Pelagomonas_calceolata.AAC.3